MKGLLAITALLILVAVIGVYENPESPSKKPAGASSSQELSNAQQMAAASSFDADAFIAEIESWESVLDAAFDDDRVYVAMYDNGASRDGYAMTVCEELRSRSYGARSSVWITVLDAVASVKEGDFKPIGKHRCAMP